VILTVEETFENVIENGQMIDGQSWPTVTTRKLTADVSVGNGETVVLGGLVKTDKGHSESGIPLLKDIPYVWKYLFGSTSDSESRSELLMFLTPYVIETAEDMAREARRRKDFMNANDVWTKGWSDSKLADPVSEAEMKDRLSRKKDMEKAWRAYREGLEEQFKTDAKVDDERQWAQSVLDTRQPLAVLTNKPVTTLTVTQSVEVIKPDGVGRPAGADDGDPVPPPVEQPKKPWWKRVF
jgi:hypothetical protein